MEPKHEFVGLGSALWIAHPELAMVHSYDDGHTLVLAVPTTNGKTFEVCFNLDYAGVRLFTSLLQEDIERAQGSGDQSEV